MFDNNTTCEEVLTAIDKWADKCSTNEPRKLWIVLTALRGPDDGNDDVKKATTQHIRGACLPHLSMRGGALYHHTPNLDTMENYLTGNAYSKMASHFRTHVLRAVRVLTGRYYGE